MLAECATGTFSDIYPKKKPIRRKICHASVSDKSAVWIKYLVLMHVADRTRIRTDGRVPAAGCNLQMEILLTFCLKLYIFPGLETCFAWLIPTYLPGAAAAVVAPYCLCTFARILSTICTSSRENWWIAKINPRHREINMLYLYGWLFVLKGCEIIFTAKRMFYNFVVSGITSQIGMYSASQISVLINLN